jgi:hypothetical protein
MAAFPSGPATSDQSAIFRETEDELSCAFCYELLREPKTLSCLHSFCCECLERMAAGQPQPLVSLPCPKCRAVTHLSSVSELRTNFHLRNLIDLYLKMRGLVETPSAPFLSTPPSCSSNTSVAASMVPSAPMFTNDWILPPSLLEQRHSSSFQLQPSCIDFTPAAVSTLPAASSSSGLFSVTSADGAPGADGRSCPDIVILLLSATEFYLHLRVNGSPVAVPISRSSPQVLIRANGLDGADGTDGNNGRDGDWGANGSAASPDGGDGLPGGDGGHGGLGGSGTSLILRR